MTIRSGKLILATSLIYGMAALIPLHHAGAAEMMSQDVTNARQETQIWTTYALSPYLHANDLKVSVSNGKATLSGKVEESVSKDLAKQIALGVSGITDVDNQIVVQQDYVPTKMAGTPTYGEVIEDASITAAVKSKLLWSKDTSGSNTEVNTKAGKVILTGQAESKESKDLAGQLASNTRGVLAVDNQLQVGKANKGAMADMKESAQQGGTEIADSWITTKVKSTYMYSSNVHGSDISVSTTKGVVTLTGKVDSGAERALAIELAKNVRGVKSVQSNGLTKL